MLNKNKIRNITHNDRLMLLVLNPKHYLARDKDGKLFLYEKKPSKRFKRWKSSGHIIELTQAFELDCVKWSNRKPERVEDLLQLKDRE